MIDRIHIATSLFFSHKKKKKHFLFFTLYSVFLVTKLASDETMTVVSSIQGDEFDDIDVGFDHEHDHQAHPHNLSRLSMCSSSMDEDDDDHHMGMYMSRLSIESFDDDDDDDEEEEEELLDELSSNDSDKEPGCYSLPATPPRRMNPTNTAVLSHRLMGVVKDYASENEGLKGDFGRPKGNKNMRKRRIIRERCADKEGSTEGISISKKKDGDFMEGYSGSFSGESEGGVVVITRPKGGRRSLCMDLEEVKACRDLGFELEHELMLEMPSAGRVSLSSSTLDTVTSGGTSPMSNWRISSPGDDPRDVKARLKVWAQAVALASSSRHCI